MSDFENRKTMAGFTMKLWRGERMCLVAFDVAQPEPDLVGFAIECRSPDSGGNFLPLMNRITFAEADPGAVAVTGSRIFPSTGSPFQKFRWVHFPWHADKDGEFLYRVTPMFMDKSETLSRGEPQEASIALMRETIPGKLNVAFTRGYVSSQSFVEKFAPDRKLSTLIPDNAKDGLTFKPTHKKAEEAYAWMGFEARASILEVLNEAMAAKAEVRVIAYDFNMPEIMTRLEKLGKRLKIIIDDSSAKGGGHKAKDSPESVAERRLRKSAGAGNVKRQHMGTLQHHKSIAVSGKGVQKVVYGSTNMSWRGFYVQSNNAIVVSSKDAVDDYFKVFESYFSAEGPGDFRDSKAAKGWRGLGVTGLDAKVAFSPHT
jgi:hypothetical protein